MTKKNTPRRTPRKGRATPPTTDADFRNPHPHPGTIGLSREVARQHYAHVKECVERIAAKLESDETPADVRAILVACMSELGAQYLRFPAVVRAAYETICLQVSRPPFLLADGVTSDDLTDLLSYDPARVAAAVARITADREAAPPRAPLDFGALALRVCGLDRDYKDDERSTALLQLVATFTDEPRRAVRSEAEHAIAAALYVYTLDHDKGVEELRARARQ